MSVWRLVRLGSIDEEAAPPAEIAAIPLLAHVWKACHRLAFLLAPGLQPTLVLLSPGKRKVMAAYRAGPACGILQSA
jgi:hypothetical protein